MQVSNAVVHVLASASALGLDSFAAGLACGPWVTSWRRRFALAAAFGATDAVAAALGETLVHCALALAIVVLCAASALVVAALARQRLALFFALPVLLSMDDLFFSGEPASAAPALGLASAALALAGSVLGAVSWRIVRRQGLATSP